MARRGSSRRTYVRDANGRFASTPGGGGPKRPATKAVKRGPNRLTRDNAGKITSQGGDGATVRGGRLKTAAGNLRGRQVAKLKTMQGVSYGKPKAKKQLQSPEARKERVDFAKDRAKEAKFLKSLPKETRRAERIAKRSETDALASGGRGASARQGIREGMTILRANFNKRKGLSPGQVASMNKSIQYSAKKLGVVLANPKPGRRLTAETLRKYAQPNKAISKARPPSTVAKPKGLKPGASMSKKPAGGFRPGQTKRLKRMQGVSYGKPAAKAKSDVGGFRPGEFYRGNFRPKNVTGKFAKGKDPYQSGKGKTNTVISASSDDKKARLGNAKMAQDFFESKGLKVKFSSNKRGSTIASYNLATKEISINRSHANWINPGSAARRSRAAGQFSSSSPMHVLYHELGHARDKSIRNRQGPFGEMWILATRQGSSDKKRAERATEMSKLSRRVSRYATTNPSEFIAETYAGRRTGRKYDNQVMDAYREARGLPQLRLKGQKPIRRKRKP